MAQAVPTLSVDGFTHNKQLILIKVFEHFLSSNYSQSNLFNGKIGSMKYLLDNYSDPYELKSGVTNVLETMYSYYFESTEVFIDVIEKQDSSEVTLAIDITVSDESGRTYTLNRSVSDLGNNLTTFDKQQEKLYE